VSISNRIYLKVGLFEMNQTSFRGTDICTVGFWCWELFQIIHHILTIQIVDFERFVVDRHAQGFANLFDCVVSEPVESPFLTGHFGRHTRTNGSTGRYDRNMANRTAIRCTQKTTVFFHEHGCKRKYNSHPVFDHLTLGILRPLRLRMV
jgi:hypothetical protein